MVASGDAVSSISSTLELPEADSSAIGKFPRRCIAFLLYLLPLGCRMDLRLCEPFSGLEIGLGVAGTSSSEALDEEFEESWISIVSWLRPRFEA